MRFGFGDNWIDYLATIDEAKIEASRRRLKQIVNIELKGKSFIDIGCGSGVHSLSAVKEGAIVSSFDFDENSVLAAKKLRSLQNVSNELWQIEKGDVLSKEYLEKYKKFDIVYSWGVLHHTGHMWQAIENAAEIVSQNGYLCIAIYNDQGWKSKFWWYVKYIYNSLPQKINKIYAYFLGMFFIFLNILKYTLLLKPMVAIGPLLNYKADRGMNILNDLVDWYGGFPFEYASIDDLEKYLRSKGFEMVNVISTNSLGCNEMLFHKI
ncbi:MAG: class I SAM-dependent methyltransferase [Saprospiraceae bacterium]